MINTSTVSPRVSVVIPNWNGVYLMKKHLKNVIDAAPNAEVVIADDNSVDGSVEYIQKNFPKVVVVANQRRVGFAGNVNSAVAKSTGDIIVLLNTDVEPQKDFLPPLVAHFKDETVFAVGCLEKSAEENRTVLRGRGLAQWDKGYYIHTRGEVNDTTTAWVSGGSGAFRRAMWDSLGGMDTLYNPFYWEDIDLSYRARKAGWKTLFEPKSVVHHYHEEGKIKREFTPGDVKKIAYRNQFIFIWKNTTNFTILLSHMLWAPVKIFRALLSGDNCMLQGYLLALQKIPQILKNRIVQSRIYTKDDSQMNIVS